MIRVEVTCDGCGRKTYGGIPAGWYIGRRETDEFTADAQQFCSSACVPDNVLVSNTDRTIGIGAPGSVIGTLIGCAKKLAL